MNNYIRQNLQTYDAVAIESGQRQLQRRESISMLVGEYLKQLKLHTGPRQLNILELGPGAGVAALAMTEARHKVTGIEFSEPTARIAERTAPLATIITDEFMRHDFGLETFDGVYAVAFIHLFPPPTATVVMKKVKQLLRDDGLALISTTKHQTFRTGEFEPKQHFSVNNKRYRVRYDKPSLMKLITSTGFEVAWYQEVQDILEPEKQWMNVIIKKRLH